MSFASQQALLSIREEITDIAAIIAGVQERLVEVTRRTDEQGESWQKTLVELERKNKEALNSAKWLRHQNEELERQVARRKPDLENAVDARNAAIRKLYYARKVIRDLVNENERIAGGAPALNEAEDQEEMRNALNDALGVSTDPDSDDTTRQNRSRPHHSSGRFDASGGPTASRPAPPHTTASEVDSLRPSVHRMETPPLESSGDVSSLSVHPEQSTTQNPDLHDEPWSIHYLKPPASSEMSFGPVSYVKLLEHCPSVTEDTVSQLESLRSTSDLCLRAHTAGDLAFVYDPIFLEAPSKTYILDWGNKSVNESLTRYMAKVKKPFHTFVYPIKKKNWFYVGAHTWKVADLWSVWPTLSVEAKHELAEKLMERCQEEHDVEGIISALDSGELRQLCVEISSQGHATMSKVFARGMGYKGRARGIIAER